MESILIWDSIGIPPNFDRIIYWNQYNNKYSLSDFIEKNSTELREKYLRFINNIENILINNKSIIDLLKIESGFSLWSMSLVLEKSPFKSKTNIECIKLLALNSQLEKLNPKTITIISSNKKLINSINNIADARNIKGNYFYKKSAKGFSINYFFKKLPYFFQSLLFLIKYSLINFKAILDKPQVSYFKNSLLILSYFDNLNSEKIKEGRFSSNYWEKLESLINEKRIKVNWMHHFVKTENISNLKHGINFVKKINTLSENNFHKLIESHFSFKILVSSFFIWLKIYLRVVFFNKSFKKRIKNITYGWLSNSIEDIFNESIFGKHLIMNIIWAKIFEDILKNIPKQSMGLYLCENQGWERAFIYYWKKYNHGELIGVAHSTISFWDLRYFNIINKANKMNQFILPVPNALAINGKGQKKELERGPIFNYELIEVEALRYLYLINYQSKKTFSPKDYNNNILILGDIQKEATNRMIKIIEEKKEYFNKYNFTFKPHPNNQINIHNYKINNLNTSNKPLSFLFELNSIVITTVFTSAQVDAIYAKKKTMLFHNPNDLNYGVLKKSDGLSYFGDSVQLMNLLQQKSIINTDLDYFNLNQSLPLWNKILSNKL